MTPLPPEIQAAIDARDAAEAEATEARRRYLHSASKAAKAKTASEARDSDAAEAMTALRSVVAKSLGHDVSQVGFIGGELWVCIDGREMTYSEAVEWVAKGRP